MIRNFFQQQLDYVFFLYGLAFLLMAGACFFLIYNKDKKFPWLWLGLFGLIHGINEWLDLIVFSLGDSPLLKNIRLAFLIVSFLSLMEFGRLSLFNLFKHPRRWIFIPFVIAAASGVVLDKDAGLIITARYSLGFAGGLFTAFCVGYVSVKADTFDRRFLKTMSIIMVFYAFTHIVVPRADFSPASLINQGVFLRLFNLPIQVIQCLLAVFLAVRIWKYWVKVPILLDAGGLFRKEKKFVFNRVVVVVVGIALTVVGWVVVNNEGESFAKQERGCRLEYIRGLAASINPESVKNLKGSSDDLVNPNYLKIKKQIDAICDIYSEHSHFHLIGSRSGKVFFFFDSAHVNGGTDAAFSGEILKKSPKELNEVFSAGKAFIDGPIIDKQGMWLNGYAPIKDPATQEVLAVLGVDINWAVWNKRILEERFKTIVALGIIWMILVVNVILFHINSASLQRSIFSESILSLVIQSIGDAVVVTDRDGNVFRMNRVAEEFTGWQFHDACGRNFSEIFCAVNMRTRHPEENIIVKATKSQKPPKLTYGTMLISRDGTERSIADSVAPLYEETGKVTGAVIVFRDITKREKDALQLLDDQKKLNEQAKELEVALKDAYKSREILTSMLDDNNKIRADLEQNVVKLEAAYDKIKETQDQLIQTEKLGLIGRMASGVAHEVKNPLGIIIQSAEFLEKQIGADKGPLREVLKMIKDSVYRADTVIKGLLNFAGISKQDIKNRDIHSILDGSIMLVRHELIEKGVRLVKDYGKDPAFVLVDENQMEQVFVNLFMNSIQAMQKGGTLTIRTVRRKMDELGNWAGTQASNFFKKGETAVMVEVIDTGCGIIKDEIAKVFEPFYTTKAAGEGVGLGMAIVRSILHSHKGLINIESPPAIELPAHEADQPAGGQACEEGKGTKVIIILKSIGNGLEKGG